MNNKTTLLIMAAGMGSRFGGGGLKQIAPVGPNGEIIMDYSVFDAKRAGFDKTVFIIKRDFEQEFRGIVGKRMEKLMDVDYAFQTMENMPPGRDKPWGTAHAILCAESVVDTPFCVINADDFYGASAYRAMNEHLRTRNEYAMAGFLLENTVSESGTVARGICRVEKDPATGEEYLADIVETMDIAKDNDFPPGTPVSMNMWGLQRNVFDYLREQFAVFMAKHGTELKSEFLIPRAIDEILKAGQEKVRVLKTEDKWYGITYQKDLEGVVAAVRAMADSGMYDGMG